MNTRTCVILLSVLALMIATSAHAAVRSVKGLWVTTSDDRLYWLKLHVPAGGPSVMVEELTGTITSASVGGSAQTTREATVTGQYLVRTGIVVLNIGEPGVTRQYAIGDTLGEGRHMRLRVFQVRPGQDLDYEHELLLDPKTEPHKP